MMKKLLPKLLLGATGVWVGSMLIYWFNLDNKAISVSYTHLRAHET